MSHYLCLQLSAEPLEAFFIKVRYNFFIFCTRFDMFSMESPPPHTHIYTHVSFYLTMIVMPTMQRVQVVVVNDFSFPVDVSYIDHYLGVNNEIMTIKR